MLFSTIKLVLKAHLIFFYIKSNQMHIWYDEFNKYRFGDKNFHHTTQFYNFKD